ncbi:MAG: hypothetical protein JO053_14760 [Acidobacteria bacterium]|nr:hypothetical protein [Acidobacteriota bacterium]
MVSRQNGLAIMLSLSIVVMAALGCSPTTSNSTNNAKSTAPTPGVSSSPAAPQASKGGERRPCSDEKDLKSGREVTAPGDLLLENATGQPVVANWIDFDGNRKKYTDISTGQKVTERSFVGHWWVITDQQGQCITIASAPGQVKITQE